MLILLEFKELALEYPTYLHENKFCWDIWFTLVWIGLYKGFIVLGAEKRPNPCGLLMQKVDLASYMVQLNSRRNKQYVKPLESCIQFKVLSSLRWMLLLKNMNIVREPKRTFRSVTSKDFLWIDNKKFWTILKLLIKKFFTRHLNIYIHSIKRSIILCTYYVKSIGFLPISISLVLALII